MVQIKQRRWVFRCSLRHAEVLAVYHRRADPGRCLAHALADQPNMLREAGLGEGAGGPLRLPDLHRAQVERVREEADYE